MCYEEFAHGLEDRKFEKGQRMAKIRAKWRHFIKMRYHSRERPLSVVLCVYVCTCTCSYVHHMSKCESGRGRQAKLMILSRLGVSSLRIQAGPMVDKCCPSHHHSY